MKYLLDTNICIKILKGGNDTLFKKISMINCSDIIIPSIVRYELYYGAYKSINKIKTLSILNEFLNSFNDRSFDTTVSELCGALRAELEKNGVVIGPYDLQIGAIAKADNLILVTNNIREFSRISGLAIEDWLQ